MNERKEGRLATTRRTADRRGRASVRAVAVLVAVVGIVGAVNYVVLNAIGVAHTPPTTTSTTKTSCSPPTAPQCRGSGASSDARPHLGMSVSLAA